MQRLLFEDPPQEVTTNVRRCVMAPVRHCDLFHVVDDDTSSPLIYTYRRLPTLALSQFGTSRIVLGLPNSDHQKPHAGNKQTQASSDTNFVCSR